MVKSEASTLKSVPELDREKIKMREGLIFWKWGGDFDRRKIKRALGGKFQGHGNKKAP